MGSDKWPSPGVPQVNPEIAMKEMAKTFGHASLEKDYKKPH